MPPEKWEEYLLIAKNNVNTLARLENKIDELKDGIYKEGGISSKVGTLWEWKNSINNIIIGIITIILAAMIGYFVTKPQLNTDIIERRLDNIEKIIKKIEPNQH